MRNVAASRGIIARTSELTNSWQCSHRASRWDAVPQVGSYIKARGGVVTADELAPFLDPPAQVRAASRAAHAGRCH